MFALRRRLRPLARRAPSTRSRPAPVRRLRNLGRGLALLVCGAALPMAPEARADATIPDLSRPLSLEQVVSLAVERNLSVAQARQGEAGARGSRTASLAGLLPNLFLSSAGYNQTTSNFSIATVDPISGRPLLANQRTVVDYWGVNLRGEANLVDLPSWYGWNSARRGVEAAREGTRDQVAAVILEAKRQYYTLLQAAELASVAQDSYALRQEQLRRAQSLFELGSVARSDVLQAQVNLAAAERDRIAAENSVAQTRAALAVLLALPVSAEFEVAPLPPVAEDVRVASEEDLLAQAERDLPALREARAQVDAARASEWAAKTRLLPSLGLSYSYGKQENEASDVLRRFKRNARWTYSVGISAPIFDGFQIYGSAQQATAQRRSREYALEQTRLTTALAVRESRLSILNAAETLRSAREGVRLAEESARLQSALYESGGGTLLELNNAQVELTRARVAVVEAEAGLRSAEAALERAIGVAAR